MLFWRLVGALLIFTSGTSFAENLECPRVLLPGNSPVKMREVDRLVARDLEATQDLAREIFKIAPMINHEFVFIGRSPTLLAALLDAQKKHFSTLRSWTLPISLKDDGGESRAAMSARYHALELLYREAGLGRRQVFVDAVVNGRSFIRLDRILTQMGREAIFVGVSDDPENARAILKSAPLVNPFVILEVPHAYMLHLSEHKALAQYPSLPLASPAASVDGRPPANIRFLDLRLKIEEELEK